MLEFKATPNEVMRAVQALRDFCEQRRISEKMVFDLALTLEECGSNIVNHALERNPQQTFRIALRYTGCMIHHILDQSQG